MYQGSVDQPTYIPTYIQYVYSAMYCAEWLVVGNPVLSCISLKELWLVWFQNVLFNVAYIRTY